MVFLPLVYPELFERFHITPPRGVLFYGPPGGRGGRARRLAEERKGGARFSLLVAEACCTLCSALCCTAAAACGAANPAYSWQMLPEPALAWEAHGGTGAKVPILPPWHPRSSLRLHRPPAGTGKTLVARALAAHASRGSGRKVAFFMRKGADVLSK